MKVLICGGSGYIGSHACVVLAKKGHDVLVLDNLSNSSRVAVERASELAGKPIEFLEGDVRSQVDLAKAFETRVDAVVHFAALKAVGESCEMPLRYFDNNITGTISLLQAMHIHDVRKLVFSSSASVYGEPDFVPVDETAPLRVTNPYGRTKLVMEDLIKDYCAAEPEFSAVLLRYFNPIGAHSSGRIGEHPACVPTNLMPYVTQVAAGKLERLRIFGGDYPTPDGSGIRDYIHVMDLAEAHETALDYISGHPGCEVFNLGTGRGHSVLEVVETFEATTGMQIPREIVGRRPGDVAALWARADRAREVLGWQAKLGLEQMCRDAWRWQQGNPDGY
jgi:UDP-glucose 4-epimerase